MSTLTAEAPVAAPASPARSRRLPSFTTLLVIVYAVAGALAALAEYEAAAGSKSSQFAIFWAAYALVLLGTVVVIGSRRTPAAAFPAVVIGLAVWGIIPKLLRTGFRILYFDEFDHFRILQGLAQTGHLQSDTGLLQIGATFPGLEVATSAFARISGVSLVAAGLTVTVLIHVVALFGIYVLVRDLSGRPQAGALAALIYSLNPSWLFFDSQFSYEGLGIAVMTWILVLVQRAMSWPTADRRRLFLTSYACVLVVCLITIHHVTSMILAILLIVWGVIAYRRSRKPTTAIREPYKVVAAVAAVSTAVTVWRLTSVGPTLFAYLAPSFRVSRMINALLGFLGLGNGEATRATLTGGLPIYEIVSAYVMIPILLVAFAWAALGMWQRREARPSLTFTLGVLGCAYFLSIPLVAVRQFSESVHRTWGFSFIGLASIVAIGVAEHRSGEHVIRLRGRQWWPVSRVSSRSLVAVGLAGLMVVAVGCVATGPDKFYRFGGPVVPGGDAVAYGTQTAMVAQWFAQHATSQDVLFADRYVGHAIAIASDVRIPNQRLLLELIFATNLGSGDIENVLSYKVNYIVIDRRMATVLPPNGFWYGYAEPGAYSKTPLPTNDVTRLGCLNWLSAVFATTDYEVYRVNRSILAAQIQIRSAGITRACQSLGVH